KFLSLPEEERWAFAGAETDEEILVRFEEALSDILSRHPSTNGSLVVVTHGGVMRAFLRERFGPAILPGDERAPNASFTRLLYDASKPGAAPELLELASTSHLMPEEERQAREQARMRTE
ncbi:MAG TPA: histidine phosphatase family protein, partial [Rubrobacteraceae bacterium]|nr:histidine phosphatase family protein [Rubrobacteraceae bacterium]